MAIKDRYNCRVLRSEPYTDGCISVDVMYVWRQYDTVANTVLQEQILRHQNIILSYNEINDIDLNPVNDTKGKKQNALYELIKLKVADWKTNQSDIAFKDMNAWMPNDWPGIPVEINLK